MVTRSSHCHHKGSIGDDCKQFSETDNNLSSRGALQNIVGGHCMLPTYDKAYCLLVSYLQGKRGKEVNMQK